MATVLIKAAAIVAASASLLACEGNSGTLDVGEGTAAASIATGGDPALAMVVRRNMGANLERMANQVAQSTHTYGVVADRFGAAEAPSVVAQEIRALLPEYQDRWNENLAAAYSAHLSPEELHSLASQGNQSPYVERFASVRPDVSSDMKTRSAPLLDELVTKALTNAALHSP